MPTSTISSTERSKLVGFVLGGTAVLLLLGGCASPAPATAGGDDSPESVAAELGAETLSGVGGASGSSDVVVAIPGGARSLVLDFECAGGGAYSVELGDSMMLGQAPLTGTCDGAHSLGWPILDRTVPLLRVTVPEDVEWTAEARFSNAEFEQDGTAAAECQRFSEIYSALVNADTGYAQYAAFDEAAWRARVDRASADLTAAAQTSDPAFTESYEAIRAVVSDPSQQVGAALSGTDAPFAAIRQLCDANQTPIVIAAEFGG
ncbi:MAG: hypothetical protein K0R99_4013 [Microbacterium sp.]|jgi:hypothetical protein|uniref:hypothetical protein n=1 Tax=Microbacterium sp. TaxID=51671 RepID=UPI00260A3F32|nr:hypothetical protein [Microbacterium sp.]MDF2562567.1 hypothetical protein [Microbacterium sp.]